MKISRKKKAAAALILFVTLALALFRADGGATPPPAYAAGDSLPFSTWTQGPGGRYYGTQTSYVPELSYAPQLTGGTPLKSPEDFAIDEDAPHDASGVYADGGKGYIYIADTGNSRIVRMDLDGNYAGEFGGGVLSEPFGITVKTLTEIGTGGATENSYIYAADKKAQRVFIFDRDTLSPVGDGIGKPTSPLVGANTPYVPVKVEVDDRGNIYVVSDGCVNGLMQLNAAGEFLGYVGANKTPVSLQNILGRLFFSQDQRDGVFKKSPRSPTNLAIDSHGLLYTVTHNSGAWDSVKKLNTSGNVIDECGDTGVVAAYVDADDMLYTVTDIGEIFLFDGEFNLAFVLGHPDGTGGGGEMNGVLHGPRAVVVTRDKRIFALDNSYGSLSVFRPTEYALKLFTAMNYYKEGRYIEGESLWSEILGMNSNFILCYRALARASMERKDYGAALRQFQLAEDRQGYSDAYWQIRNTWMKASLTWWILGIALFIIALVVVKKLYARRKLQFMRPAVEKVKTFFDFRIVRETRYALAFAVRPGDAMYEVKEHKRASLPSAGILYAWFVLLQILGVVVTGFLFTTATPYNTNGANMALTTIGILALAVVCNYLVSSVTDGEGKFRQVIIAFIYGLTPYLLLSLPLYIFTNVLTYNESVFIFIYKIVMYGWTALTLFRSIQELHDFTFWQTVKNIFLTALTFLMAILFFVVLRMLVSQAWGYLADVLKELFS